MRNIIVRSNAQQKVFKFESNAQTVGELKQEFNQVGINYDGLQMVEGVSKVVYTSDEQRFPESIQKQDGTITRDLVFILTNTQKNISSGMERAELMAAFKASESLKNNVKELYGKNYTNCSTAILEEVYINSLAIKPAPAVPTTPIVEGKPSVSSPILVQVSTSRDVNFLHSVMEAVFTAMSAMVCTCGEGEPDCCPEEEIKSDYSSDELNAIFDEFK